MLKCSKNGCFIRNLQQNGYQAMDKQQEMSNESQKPCKHWVYKSEVLTPRPYWSASIDTILAFLFCQKWLSTRIFSTFAIKINFIVSKLTTQKSKRSDLILHVFHPFKSQWNFSQKNNFIVTEISFIVGEKFHFWNFYCNFILAML